MPATLVLVHTIPALVALFDTWCAEQLPGVRVLHLLDQPMLERIRQRGRRDPEDDERLAAHVEVAEAIHADIVLVTCSSVSLSVAAVRHRPTIPVLAIDDPLAREAVLAGRRITVLATAATTLEPSRLALERTAERLGRPVEVRLHLVEDALAALLSGDRSTHDRLVGTAVREVAADADVVVLAQATMAGVLGTLEASAVPVPVLASPPLALAEVRRLLSSAGESSPPAELHQVRR
jgi:Asp/Glu/hydantoin racemase